MKDIKHVFFDLDHTLWDFEKNSTEALKEIYHQLNLNKEISDLPLFIEIYQRINAEYWSLYNHGKVTKEKLRTIRFEDTLNHFNILNAAKKAETLAVSYLKTSPNKTHIFPNVHKTLTYLKNSYQLHIITNGFKEVQFKKLNNCDLTNYFSLILCTEEVGVNKPNPLVFETALNRTNALPNQSIMIGDNPETDIKGAQNCGLHTILFNPHKLQNTTKSVEIHDLKELIQLL